MNYDSPWGMFTQSVSRNADNPDEVRTVLEFMDAAEHAESLGLELEASVDDGRSMFVLRQGTDKGEELACYATLTEVGLWLDGYQAATDGGDA